MSKSKSKQKLSDRYSTGSDSKRSSGFSLNQAFSKLLIVTTTIIIVVVVGVVLFSSMSGNEDGKDSDDVASYNVVVTPDNIEELLDEKVSKVDPGTYDVSMNSTWQFKNAQSASKNAYVANVLSNSNTISFVVKRDDTGEVIYESPYIPVGSRLKNIKLNDEKLSKGTYPCTLTYSLLNSDYKEVSTVNFSVSIVIEND